MKKILTFIFAILLVFTLVSCGDENYTKNSEDALTFAEFNKAEVNSKIVLEAYVQDFESWWNNKQTVYLADKDGSYLGYELPLTEEQSNALKIGDKLRIEGIKMEYSGQLEIGNATKVEVIEGHYVKEATDVSKTLTNEYAVASLSGGKIKAQAKLLASAGGKAFLANWDGSGEVGKNDLYFNVEINGNQFTFNVRRYLRSADSDVYKAVAALTEANIGQDFIVEAFVYIYNGQCQARVISFQAK